MIQFLQELYLLVLSRNNCWCHYSIRCCNWRNCRYQIEVQDFTLLGTNLVASSDNTLYTKLPKANVSNVDLTSASINIRKEFTVNIASNTLSSVVTGGDNETFTAFDEERYALIRTDGSTEVLTADRLVFSNGGKSINSLTWVLMILVQH